MTYASLTDHSGTTGDTTFKAIYLALAETLRQELANGGSGDDEEAAFSEHALARRERVSRVTVRRASDLLIREGLLERRPGKGLFRVGRGGGPSLARPRPKAGVLGCATIQVVAGNLSWEPCLQTARGVQAAARDTGAMVQIYDAHGNEAADLQVIRRLADGPAQGAVIVALHSAGFTEALCELKLRDYPFVLVDQRLAGIDVSSVLADNRAGGAAIGQHLVGLGHRRIAFVGDLEADTVRARLDGLRDAMGDARLPFDRSLVFDLKPERRLEQRDWSQQVDAHATALFARRRRPSAIFASCDGVARLVLASATRHGLRVPRDLSLAGFDDDPLALQLQPTLTSVRQPFHDMGVAACRLLEARLADASSAAQHLVLPVSLMVRDSTGPAPKPA